MKLRLNKLMAGLVMAGSALALVGCGGGGAPDLVVKTDAVTAVSPATIDTTKVLVAAASGATFTLPTELTFVGTSGNATAPAGSVLEITQKPDASGNEFAGFKLTSGSDSVTGVIEAGSCLFRVTESTGIFTQNWTVGQTFVQSPCNITLPVVNAAVGATVNVPILLTLGTMQITAGNKTISVTVTAAPNGGATISVGGSVITVTPLPTGAAAT